MSKKIKNPKVSTKARVATSTKNSKLSSSSRDISIGTALKNGHRANGNFRFNLNSLKQHALVCGMTGSGKTNTCFYLLQQLWQHKIPFLVLESAKSEYRQLMLSSTELKNQGLVYTIGDEVTSPIRLNPFQILKGVKVSAHIEALKSIFNASFEMWAPMPQVLAKALNLIYTNRGWDLLQNKNLRLPSDIAPGDANCPPDIYPTMKDLYEIITPLTESYGYSERIGPDVSAALRARIGGLVLGPIGRVLSARSSTPLETLFSQPVVIELKDVFSDSDKTLFASTLLLFLSEYRKVQGPSSVLQHAFVLEDGHRLLRNRHIPNDKHNVFGNFTEFFSDMLSELGAYGEGIIVSSQSPGQLSPEILGNSNLKMIHQLTAQNDLVSVSGANYLNPLQLNKIIVALAPGQALLCAGNMAQSSLRQLPELSELKLPPQVADSDTMVRNAMSKLSPASKTERHFSCNYCSDSLVLELATSVSDDLEFRRIYNRYVLSTIKDSTQLVHFRAQIVQAVQRIIGGKEKSVSTLQITWCALCQATDRYFEQKGIEHYWFYDDVEKEKQKWLNLLKTAFLPTDKPTKLETDVVKEWAVQFTQMQKRDCGPLVTCGPCTSKCLYKFEVSEIVDDPLIKVDFNASINRDDMSSSESAAWFCRLLAERTIGKFDIDLAYCFAVHLIANQQLSTDAQLVLLHKVRTILEEYEKENI